MDTVIIVTKTQLQILLRSAQQTKEDIYQCQRYPNNYKLKEAAYWQAKQTEKMIGVLLDTTA